MMSDTGEGTKNIWSIEQVSALDAYQKAHRFHPFTCPNRHDHFDNGIDKGGLIPTRRGWICQCCDYTQAWAHDFMLTFTANPIVNGECKYCHYKEEWGHHWECRMNRP